MTGAVVRPHGNTDEWSGNITELVGAVESLGTFGEPLRRRIDWNVTSGRLDCSSGGGDSHNRRISNDRNSWLDDVAGMENGRACRNRLAISPAHLPLPLVDVRLLGIDIRRCCGN